MCKYTPEQMAELGMTMDVREKVKLGLLGTIPKTKSRNKVNVFVF